MSFVLNYFVNMACTIGHRSVNAFVNFPFYSKDDEPTLVGGTLEKSITGKPEDVSKDIDSSLNVMEHGTWNLTWNLNVNKNNEDKTHSKSGADDSSCHDALYENSDEYKPDGTLKLEDNDETTLPNHEEVLNYDKESKQDCDFADKDVIHVVIGNSKPEDVSKDDRITRITSNDGFDQVENQESSVHQTVDENLELEVSNLKEMSNSLDDNVLETIAEPGVILKSCRDLEKENESKDSNLQKILDKYETRVSGDSATVLPHNESRPIRPYCDSGIGLVFERDHKNECFNLTPEKLDKEEHSVNDRPMCPIVPTHESEGPQTPKTDLNSENTSALETKMSKEIGIELKFTGISVILEPSRKEDDASSTCSNDSWHRWIGKFMSNLQPKSPIVQEVSPVEISTTPEEVLTEECDCTKSHCCLQLGDIDEGCPEMN